MAHGNSKKAIFAGLAANVGIGLIKFVAFALTGLSSMLTEGIHSMADSGNGVLLLIGDKRATKAATKTHNFGYGRERYIFSFVVAIILFSAGGLFSLYEAYEKITEALAGHGEHAIEGWKQWVPFVVLLISILLEGWSLKTAMAESSVLKGKHSWYGFIRRAKNPELPVVLLENLAAVVGLLFALGAVTMTMVTGDIIYDGIGAAMIGGLLTVMAGVLMVEMKSLLVGESVTEDENAAIERALLETDGVEAVIYVKTQHLSPEEVLVGAKVAIDPSDSGREIADIIDEAEEAIREVVPSAAHIFIEPDVLEDHEAVTAAEEAADQAALASTPALEGAPTEVPVGESRRVGEAIYVKVATDAWQEPGRSPVFSDEALSAIEEAVGDEG